MMLRSTALLVNNRDIAGCRHRAEERAIPPTIRLRRVVALLLMQHREGLATRFWTYPL